MRNPRPTITLATILSLAMPSLNSVSSLSAFASLTTCIPRRIASKRPLLQRKVTCDAPELSYLSNSAPMPDPLPPLKNTYYMLRHGQSAANVEGIISSDRSLARSERHGLTELGWEQAVTSARNLLDLLEVELQHDEQSTTKHRVFLYSSPFARARQTAEACLQGFREAIAEDAVRVEDRLKLSVQFEEGVILEDGLMERYFGRLDGAKLFTYAYVWPVDLFDVTHKAFDVESVAEVAARVGDAIRRIDASSRHADGGDIIVLASHADTLQITQLYAAGMPNVGKFSQYRFANGEVRAMKRTIDSLPEPVPLLPPKPGK